MFKPISLLSHQSPSCLTYLHPVSPISLLSHLSPSCLTYLHPVSPISLPSHQSPSHLTNLPSISPDSLIPEQCCQIGSPSRPVTDGHYESLQTSISGQSSLQAPAQHRRVNVTTTQWDDHPEMKMKWNEWCFSPQICTVSLYWAGDSLGQWDGFCYESCPKCRIDRSTYWSAAQCITIVLWTPAMTTLNAIIT